VVGVVPVDQERDQVGQTVQDQADILVESVERPVAVQAVAEAELLQSTKLVELELVVAAQDLMEQDTVQAVAAVREPVMVAAVLPVTVWFNGLTDDYYHPKTGMECGRHLYIQCAC